MPNLMLKSGSRKCTVQNGNLFEEGEYMDQVCRAFFRLIVVQMKREWAAFWTNHGKWAIWKNGIRQTNCLLEIRFFYFAHLWQMLLVMRCFLRFTGRKEGLSKLKGNTKEEQETDKEKYGNGEWGGWKDTIFFMLWSTWGFRNCWPRKNFEFSPANKCQ